MKPIALLSALAVLVFASSAGAQNASQISAVRNGANCPRCNLFQADLSNLTLKNKNLAGARLRQADFSTAIMNRTRFTGGDLRDVNAYGAVMTGASFARADLTNASFVGAYLQGANFSGARLSGANFSGAEMDRAVGITQAQLDQACGDGSTYLPGNLRIPLCR